MFARGEAYFASDSVTQLKVNGDLISARVEGTESYRVKLWDDDGELGYECTCPHWAEGFFCKHCVAVGLSWLARQDKNENGSRKTHKKVKDPWQSIQDYLSRQKPETLINLIIELAESDKNLYKSLLFKAEKAAAGGNVQAIIRKAITRATQVRGFIDWREAGDFADQLRQLTESLQELLTPDSASASIELAEYAIERIENALQDIDDSNGEVGSVVDELGTLHRQACEMASPDPEKLAEHLFRLEMTLPFCICSFSASSYADVLGANGLNRYRELAQAEWQSIEPKTGGDRFEDRRWRITRTMESLARASGNVEELVAIKAKDLTLPYHYLEIAQILKDAGQSEKALEWAERGLRAFPKITDNRLRDFLVDAYLKRQRNDEAIQLTWIQFEENLSLENYKKLYKIANRLGIWTIKREQALARVAAAIASNAEASMRWHPKPLLPNYSLRLEIALWEKNIEEAWAATQAGVCHPNLLLALAGKLEKERVDNALSLYRRVIPVIIDQANNKAYQDAINLVRKVESLMRTQERLTELGHYLNELRVRFKAKRNFIRLLDGVIDGLKQ